jgi:glucose-6-phosphate 1-epimerase
MLGADDKKAWPYKFGLTYSVTLSPAGLETTMHVRNNGESQFEFQTLFHTYLRIPVSSLIAGVGVSAC